jgi:hypothetical protein
MTKSAIPIAVMVRTPKTAFSSGFELAAPGLSLARALGFTETFAAWSRSS